MPYQTSPRVPVSLIVLLVSTVLLVYGLARYRRESEKSELIAFVGFMFAISLTQTGVIMGDTETQPEQQLFWTNFVNGISLLLVIYTLLWFALAYADHEKWINRWTVGAAVCHVAASGITVVLAPEFMYEVTGQSTSGPVTFLGITVEEWVFIDRNPKLPFILVQLYSYLITLVSGFVIARYIVRNRLRLYAGQIATLAIGFATPIFLNLLMHVGVIPLRVNYTTMSMGVTSIAFAVAIFRYRLLRLAPVGRQQLIDAMDDPVIMVDTKNRVVDCNRTARYINSSSTGWRGVSTGEFFDSFPVELTHPDDFSNTKISYTQNGETRYFDPMVTPIYTEKTRLAGYSIVLREVTELYRRNQQIREQNERLEQFAQIVSHDLRNPLVVAEGRLELAQDEVSSSHLDDAADAIHRSQTLVDDLLMLARANESLEDPGQVSLSELAEDCWQVIPTDGVSLEVETDQTVSADSTLLRQLLENLLANAVEHGGAETVTVDETPDGFYIADDGSGLPTADYDEVFEPGFSTTPDGTGLGLQIVDQIVEAHDWTIRVTDSADGGAKFEITDLGAA